MTAAVTARGGSDEPALSRCVPRSHPTVSARIPAMSMALGGMVTARVEWIPMGNLLVTGGFIVDGTGAAAHRGDVRVRDGVIVELGADLGRTDETVVDATDAYVTPGLIDCHTHFDGEMFWDPSLDPLPLYGMTTAIMGNCGLGIAPIRPDTRDAVADLMC